MGRNISFTSLSAVLVLFAYEVNVSIEHWQNDTEREIRSTGRKPVSQYHVVQYKSHKDWC